MSAPLVQTLWIGPTLKPLHTECLQSFLNQGYSVDLYSYEKVQGVPDKVNFRDASEILPAETIFAYQRGPGKGSFSAFSNVFRYALLFKQGGIWIDTDVFCFRPFLFESSPYLFASETLTTEGERILASCLIKSPAQSQLMKTCLEESLKKKKEDLEWGEIGPLLLTKYVKQFQLETYVEPSWRFCSIGWDEPELLWDLTSSWRPPKEAWGLHLNHEILRRTQRDFTPEIIKKLRQWAH